MSTLETRIPPPFVALILAVATWGVSLFTQPLTVANSTRYILVGAFCLVAVVFGVPAVRALRSAKTTLDPVHIDRVTKVVTGGVYRHSRNPMYVALASLLFAWAAYLDTPLGFLGPLLFISYIDRYQIRPEERVLEAMFGAPYLAYKARVRRWL